MVGAAFRTCPFPDIEVLDFGILVPTLAACLTGGVPTVNLDQILSFTLAFVFKHMYKSAPPIIVDGLSKMETLGHGVHVQIFDANKVMLADKPG